MSLFNSYESCDECNKRNTSFNWCHACNAKHFQQNFKNWTSGDNDIDKFIQDAQLSAKVFYQALEWIPYDRFYDIEYIAKGGFGEIYKAKWIDGFILNWDNTKKRWKRNLPNMFVALKRLNNSKDVTLEFINEITSHHKIIKDNYGFIIRFYGITQDPKTKNYIIVLNYAEHGNLRNYLDKSYSNLDWKYKIGCLRDIAMGLSHIHKSELIHRDLHIGNILMHYNALITDMGLCKPADYNTLEHNVYGVLPYIAPEILQGQNYTKAVDIYSFGIIMYEVISGLRPYNGKSHDENLAIKICQGLRPKFNIKVPKLILYLIKQCLDANPSNRPPAKGICDILSQWWVEIRYNPNEHSELIKQIKEADEINSSIPSISLTLSYETHTEDIYTSRLPNFNNLPEPKNSKDYYKQYDNITSMEYSDSLQIDISQLKISDAGVTKERME